MAWPCTGTGWTSRTPRTASPGSPRTRWSPGEDHTYRWVAPDAGTYWYHSHQMSHEQVSGGLLGGIMMHPEDREPGVRDVLAVAHLYDDVPTIDGRHGFPPVVAASRDSGSGSGVVNTDNGPQNAWASAPFLVRAVDGVDVNEPTEVTDRSVEHPRRRSGRPGGPGADRRLAPCASQMLGGVGSRRSDPQGSERRAVKQPESELDLLDYGSPATSASTPAHPDRKFEYSVGRRPGFLNGKPGLWWSVNGKLYPDMPMIVVSEGDVVRVRISNHSGKAHPMHLHGHHALVLSRDGSKATGSPWWFDSLEVRER